MKIVLSEKFQDKWDGYLDYCVSNYGKALTEKKKNLMYNALGRLSKFPESGRKEPLLNGRAKTYRAVLFDTQFKIIYTINEDHILCETLWNMRRNPDKLQKEFR